MTIIVTGLLVLDQSFHGILTSFCMNEDARKELRADFIHLRTWRKIIEQANGVDGEYDAILPARYAGHQDAACEVMIR